MTVFLVKFKQGYLRSFKGKGKNKARVAVLTEKVFLAKKYMSEKTALKVTDEFGGEVEECQIEVMSQGPYALRQEGFL